MTIKEQILTELNNLFNRVGQYYNTAQDDSGIVESFKRLETLIKQASIYRYHTSLDD